MKKINKYLGLLILAVIFTSCQNDGGDSDLGLANGVVPNFQKSATEAAFINLIEVEAGNIAVIGFNFDIALGNAQSADVVGFYASGANLYGPVALRSGITEFPIDITLDQNDIIAAFSELSSADDFLLADNLIITAKFYYANGEVQNMLNDDGSRNYGSDIHTSAVYNAQIQYPVSCPSDLAGNYTVVSSGFSTDGAPVNNPLVDFAYDVVLTDLGGGSYEISDGVAGVYIDWYCDAYGYCFETTGNFTDVCGTLNGAWTEAFGCEVVLTGTVGEDGTLLIQWANCFGDEIEEAIYTRN